MYSYDLNQDTVATTIRDTGLQAIEATLNIFPNPVNSGSKIRIETPCAMESKLFMLDISGKRIGNKLNLKLQSGLNEIGIGALNLHHLTKGVYFVVLDSGDKIIAERIVAGL